MSYYDQIFADEQSQELQQGNALANQVAQGLTPAVPSVMQPTALKPKPAPAPAPQVAPAQPQMSDKTNKTNIKSAERNTLTFLRALQGIK